MDVRLGLRLVTGAVFIGFSLGKFLRHDAEAAAFDRYGIPLADLSTYLVGCLELAGGVALVLGVAVRPVAVLLACNMAGAILTAGRIEGGPVHLGLAPILLLAMVYLALKGAGPRRISLTA
jgi:putative oxidoreductase